MIRATASSPVRRRLALFLVVGIIAIFLLPPFTYAERGGSAARAEHAVYKLGVFPHLPPRELEKIFAPIAADFSEVLGRKVLFRSSSTFGRFMRTLNKQKYDIVFVQPFDYVVLADKFGYKPLATRSEPLAAILVVKPGSRFKTIKDLKGQTIALPPKVAAVSYLTKDNLRRHGIDPNKDVKFMHQRSHVSCMQQVLIGKAAACGTAAPAVRFFQHRMNVRLRVMARSREIPHTLFAVSPRIPKHKRRLLRQRILSWHKSKAGRAILKRGRLTPFIKISDEDYDIVREMSKDKH